MVRLAELIVDKKRPAKSKVVWYVTTAILLILSELLLWGSFYDATIKLNTEDQNS